MGVDRAQRDGHLNERQLIVIGNGFDLACGLKSSYTDFFAPRLDKAESIKDLSEEEWRAAVDEAQLTAWDFILRIGVGGPNWCNVEKVLGDWVLPTAKADDDKDDAGKSPADRLLDILDLPVFLENPPRIVNDIVMSKLTTEPEHRLRDVARLVWHKTGYQPGRGMDRSGLLVFLRMQLDELEAQFRNYLVGQITSSAGYRNNAIGLLADMACDGLDWSEAQDYDKACASVLSFNYTAPFDYSNRIVDEASVVNIHGKLDGEIIFGVDGKECMADLGALPFTKTYRVASMGVKMSNPLYGTPGSSSGEFYPAVIKFFGHSLGEADYSYFQALFDGVDLYGGGTRLVFYYRPWPEKDEGELRTEKVKEVARLLTAYGETLDNRDHGKNLMHKLLLEGRLEVKQLMKRGW